MVWFILCGSEEAVCIVDDLEVCGGFFFCYAERVVIFVGMVDQ